MLFGIPRQKNRGPSDSFGTDTHTRTRTLPLRQNSMMDCADMPVARTHGLMRRVHARQRRGYRLGVNRHLEKERGGLLEGAPGSLPLCWVSIKTNEDAENERIRGGRERD